MDDQSFRLGDHGRYPARTSWWYGGIKGANVEHDATKPNNSRFRFRISSLLIFTTIVALHVAFPLLQQALITTLLLGALLGLLLYGVLWVVLLYDAKSPFSNVVCADHPIVERWARRLAWMLVPLYFAFLGLFAYASR